ncbi:MAG: hypothetical protein HN778_14835 [Prolixibacteraceae bacterium]|jgi:hypothetical protein|nr:hypothetical protein [Prolixibacteraceae bacterium]MBT6763703.1 hypothetical protein [Prolixibacteraceae bacterium]MBT6997678.1 hypothetical protein [Prolixibacteraceae bacterium]MBT7396104.1 hypothetical protein [Prolixibacteraceae bacterium]
MKNAVLLFLVGFILFQCTQTDTDDLDLSIKIQKVGDENILYDSAYFNWGSSIIKGEDGKYHLFYAQMPREHGFHTWLTNGVISHAVSDSPAGPYKHKEIVLEGRGTGYWDAHTAHNPRIKYFEGKYYIYYMSTNLGGQTLTPEEWDQAQHERYDNKFRSIVRENQRIGVAVSESIDGPWTRFDKPIVEPGGPIAKITCNPAITQRPDGGYLMLVRGDKPDENDLVRSQAVALSPTPIGPWEIQPKAAVGDLNSEDPAVWYDHNRKRYYGIYHAFGYIGLITSLDGLNWKNAKHYKVLGKSYSHKNGKEIKATKLERPFVFVEDGVAKVLTVGMKETNGDSYSMFIPLE